MVLAIIKIMKKIITFAIALSLLASCRKELSLSGADGKVINPLANVSNVTEIKVPAGFQYKTTQETNFEISILGTNNDPVKFTKVTLSTDSKENGGEVVAIGATDENGLFKTNISLATCLKQVTLNTSYIGIPPDIILDINSPKIYAQLGGKNPKKVKTAASTHGYTSALGKTVNKLSYRLGGWNSLGVPNNVVVPNDIVSTQMLTNINTLLPSAQSVAVRNPQLLDDNACTRTLLINQTCDLWVTFVTEGANNRSTLFYYKYHKNFPPQTPSDIDSMIVVFANSSFLNSGGGLATGNKVYIGQVGADTVIAYGIISNGFNIANATIGNGQYTLFANKDLNPESNPALRQHMVLVNDLATNRLVMGFEDIRRDYPNCDHDFNDVMFYTTSNPVAAITTSGVSTLPNSNDTDGDGIKDSDDEYPTDPLRAFNNYYPSVSGKASVAFEDLWPYKGDYDLNDVVVDYKYKIVTNAGNRVKDVNANYTLRASGGIIQNSFAVEFPTLRSNVIGLTGAMLESGQNNAVISVFSNSRTEMQDWNTFQNINSTDTVNYNVNFTLTTPVNLSSFGLNEYNPFIWGNSHGKDRGYEIHLAGKSWTGLANTALLGTGHDDTKLNGSKTYLTLNNLPFAINIPERFAYPIESADITSAHLKFAAWAQSGGTLFPDWYKNLSGNRNSINIYNRLN
jgi:LruC domain-containing protein